MDPPWFPRPRRMIGNRGAVFRTVPRGRVIASSALTSDILVSILREYRQPHLAQPDVRRHRTWSTSLVSRPVRFGRRTDLFSFLLEHLVHRTHRPEQEG